MIDMGVINESHSDWSHPLVLVPKVDCSVWFCMDIRTVSVVSKFDTYPMPCIDKMLNQLGVAHIYLILDVTKGYWQIPFTPMSHKNALFYSIWVTPMTHGWDFLPPTAYATFYLDYSIIYNNDWQRHTQHLRDVLRSLRQEDL